MDDKITCGEPNDGDVAPDFHAHDGQGVGEPPDVFGDGEKFAHLLRSRVSMISFPSVSMHMARWGGSPSSG